MPFLKKILAKNTELKIFIFFFFIFLLLGILLSYNFDFTRNYNLLFESDTGRVIKDITTFDTDHYRINVHPLFLIIMHPIYLVLNLLISNSMLTIIIMSSISTSLTIVFIYKILSEFSSDILTKILILLCYALSFTNIIYTAGIETYSFATLFLVILFYYFIKKINHNNNNNIIFVFLGIFTFAFTITNYLVFLIILFVLFIAKKIKLLNAITIFLMSIIFIGGLNAFQYMIWPNTPFIFKSNLSAEQEFANYNINLENISNVYQSDYSNSIIANDVSLKVLRGYKYNNSNYMIDFTSKSLVNKIFVSIFYIVSIFLVFRNFKKNTYINLALLLTLLYNTILHTIYGNDSCFLYSMHFIYLIFLITGINLLTEKNKHIKKYFLIYIIIFFIYELIKNIKVFTKILNITSNVLSCKYFYTISIPWNTILIIIICITITYLIYLLIKKFKNIVFAKKYKLIAILIFILIITKWFFLCFSYLSDKFNNIYITKYNSTLANYTYHNLEKEFKDEIAKLKEYDSEYQDFISEYNPQLVDNLNAEYFYFFGFANRKKLAFLKKGLYDLDNNIYIYKLDIKSYAIIPNIYTVLIETTNDDYIKIYEDEFGVHFVKNNHDHIIKGTDIQLSLYNFDNQKYANIKKVLYSEILFNIKDSTIYPNILVYDNPWYRDAALVSMVLENTNNTDLIADWINNIEEVYDLQNKGNQEPDNLGELLYIISTQKERNIDLINKIINEANSIASSNGGKYLNGNTDYAPKPLYQTLWYKLGIERLGYNYPYDTSNLNDDYYNLTWWSDCNNTYNEINPYHYNYPYLNMAQYHKLKKGVFFVNKNLYPLSWEKSASEANYRNLKLLSNYYVENRISPTHAWTAAEMLLFLLDETGDLKKE